MLVIKRITKDGPRKFVNYKRSTIYKYTIGLIQQYKLMIKLIVHKFTIDYSSFQEFETFWNPPFVFIFWSLNLNYALFRDS